MTRITRLGALLTAAAGSVASAQIITTSGITASLDLTWQEDPVYPHNDNGVLEPGERALMLMSLSFTGQNTLVSFWPPAGQFSSGTIQAFAMAYLDIRSDSPDPFGLYNGGITSPTSSSIGPNANLAGTSGYGVRGAFRLGGRVANGQPVPNGFANILPGQLPEDPDPLPLNPVANLERLGWAPAGFTPRTVTFSARAAATAGELALGLYLDFDGLVGGEAFLPLASIRYGAVDIPVVPAPSPVALLALAGVLARRRRERPMAGAQGEFP